MKLLIFLPALLCIQISIAQKRAAVPATIDINQLVKMKPEELTKYKEQLLKTACLQATTIAAENNFKIDETSLPGFEIKQPVKDLKRLAMLPIAAPTQSQLLQEVDHSIQQIKKSMLPKALSEVNQLISQQNAAQLQNSSVAMWYSDRPAQALYMSMNAVKKQSDSVVGWNNLAALYNMAGAEQKAIPILMRQLIKAPDNSLVLNNMGQAYLGLGDLDQAQNYLTHCLSIDELNPEANHSMGMINYFKQQYDAAAAFFQKELQVAYRQSTLVHLKRLGIKINLVALRKKRPGVPDRDFFEEIELAKFDIPSLPMTAAETTPWKNDHADLMTSIAGEMLSWKKTAEVSVEQLKQEGKEHFGLYADLVNELLSELGDQYIPLLGLIKEDDVATLTNMANDYYEKLHAAICPQPPVNGEHGPEVMAAYDRKCCDLHTPLADEYVNNINSFIRVRLDAAMSNWKQYINGAINIVRLDPSPGNKRLVYSMVSNYFAFLANAINAINSEPMPAECHSKYNSARADSVILSNHNIDINCPKWLNVELDLQVAKIKADCSKYAIEAGKGFIAGYEKNFKTGMSTIAVGAGASQSFVGIGKAGIKQMIYVTYDNNNQFSDFGLKGSAEIKAGLSGETQVAEQIVKASTTIAGVEGGYTLGINSGFNAGIKGKGIIAEFINGK